MIKVDKIISLQQQIANELSRKRCRLVGFVRERDVDKVSRSKRIHSIVYENQRFSLIERNSETKNDLDLDNRSWFSIEDLSSLRNDGIWYRLNAIKRFLDDGNIRHLKFWFYAIGFKEPDKNFKISSFVSEKTKEYAYTRDITGYYYNPEVLKEELFFVENGWTDTYTIRCWDCDKRIPNFSDKKLTIVDGRYFCDSCLKDRNYGKCDITGTMGFRRVLKFSCPEDRKAVLERLNYDTDAETINVSSSFCDSRYIYTCQRCKCSFVGDSSYCTDCRDGIILNYSDKNYAILDAENEGYAKTHYGFELETESKQNTFEAVYAINKKIKDLVKIKHDGSLNNGFEIVSNTLSYKKFLSIRKRLTEAFNLALEKGCCSQKEKTTGLHIHISRCGFKDANHLARFCQAWYLYKAFTKYVAQRDFNDYCKWDGFISQDKDFFKKSLDGDLFSTSGHGDRYKVINLSNDETVEIRCFKGILSAEYLYRVIELCELIKSYTENIDELKKKEMLKFILSHSSKMLKGWIKMFLVKDRYEIREELCA